MWKGLALVSILFIPGWALADEPSCFRFDARLGHAAVPHCETRSSRFGKAVEIRYNSKGLRDREYAPHPSKGTLRILVLGGAYLTGPGLPQDKSPVEFLKAEFGRVWKKPFEIINGATEGYFSIQSAIHLRELLAAYHPHFVVYFPTANPGFFRDDMLEEFVEYGSDSYPNRIHVPTSFSESLRAEWKRVRRSWQLRGEPNDRKLKLVMAATQRMMALMREETTRRGAGFDIFWRQSVVSNGNKSARSSYPWLVGLASLLSPTITIPALDTRQYLISLDPPTRPLDTALLQNPECRFPGSYDLNEKGSELFGRIVARTLFLSLMAKGVR